MTTNDEERDQSNVDAMLSGGTFRIRESIRQQLWNQLQTETQKGLRKPTRWPVFRPTLVAVVVALVALALISVGVVALSPKEKAASVVYGISAIYHEGLIQTVSETHMLGDISVTLDWVYADPNQILVAYSGQGSSEDTRHLEIEVVSAVLDDGTYLKGGPASGYGQPGIESSVASFAMPENEKNRDALQVQIVLSVAHTQYLESPSQVLSTRVPAVQVLAPLQIERSAVGEVTFSTTIQVKPGRVFKVNKTVEYKGIAVSLEQVSIAPSLTLATLCFQVPDPEHFGNWLPVASMITAGQHFSGGGDGGYRMGDQDSCQQVSIRESVPLSQKQYTFQVDELVGFEYGPNNSPTLEDYTDKQMRIKGPWVFQLK